MTELFFEAALFAAVMTAWGVVAGVYLEKWRFNRRLLARLLDE